MSKPIGLTVISNEAVHLELADGLRENLAEFGYDLVIHIVDKDKANDWQSLQNWYQIKDEAFVEFASQEKRRTWLLDSEVRIVRDLPTRCIDSDKSVIFYTDDDLKIYPPINTGQCIFSRDMIPFYAQSIQIAKEKKEANLMPSYNVEYVLLDLDIPQHIKELISFDRRIADKDSICSRGLFVNDKTCITHPYLHNVSLYMDEPEDIPLLTPRTFLNHFSPFDYDLALKILDLMKRRIDDFASWRSLPLQRFVHKKQFVSYFSEICPKNIDNNLKNRNHMCFCIGDWYFCPKLRMAGPKKYWSEYAYQLTDN